MCRIGSVFFIGYCKGLAIVLYCFSLLSYMLGVHEKRTEHISFLAFETNVRKQAHYDKKKKTDACTSHSVDIIMLYSSENRVCQFFLVV